jgi:hypothetical protein
MDQSHVTRLLKAAAFALTTVVLCALVLEFGYRAASGVEVVRFGDWRDARFLQGGFSFHDYDPVVGWVHKAHLKNGSLNTIEFGIRRNAPENSRSRLGGVLVVGDSLAAGAGVADDQTWPHYLEELIGQPVLNAAVGSWGIDQMVLRVEQLRPALNPRVVIVAPHHTAITVTGFAVYFGVPKPYFTIRDGALIARNQPVPMGSSAQAQKYSPIVNLLSYSYVAAQLMGTMDPNYWFSSASAEQQFVRTGVDEVDVSCSLLARLKKSNDAEGIRTVLMMQYGLDPIAQDRKPIYADQVVQCARQIGLEVVDTFDALRVVWKGMPRALEDLYLQDRGHMTDGGNRFIADQVAVVLSKPGPEGAAGEYDLAEHPGDGINRVISSEALQTVTRGAGVDFKVDTEANGARPTTYSLTATGYEGEHYVQLPGRDTPAGAYVFSVFINPSAGTRVRLQLLDKNIHGVIVDFNFEERAISAQKLGRVTALRSPMEPIEGSWYKIAVTTVLPAEGARALIQLLDKAGRNTFVAQGESVRFHSVQLEAGQRASSYRIRRGVD